ncbi:hypothetical protein WN943_002886 [Citrus x changshan-huyou]
MGASGDYRPAMAMLSLQCSYAGVALFTRAALLQGMSPRVSVVYRQAMATLIIAPIAYFSRRKSRIPPLGFKSFSLIFLTAFIVVTINQNMFYEGLYLASSTMGTATGNLIPAITFVLAAIISGLLRPVTLGLGLGLGRCLHGLPRPATRLDDSRCHLCRKCLIRAASSLLLRRWWLRNVMAGRLS